MQWAGGGRWLDDVGRDFESNELKDYPILILLAAMSDGAEEKENDETLVHSIMLFAIIIRNMRKSHR